MFSVCISRPSRAPLAERRSRAGLERPFGQPGRASEHARTAAPFTGATAQKRCRRVVDERGASLAAGARAGAEVFEKPSGDGDDDGDGDDAQGSGVSVRSRLDLSSALQRAHRPTARSARKRGGCGTGRGLCRLPPVRARAHDGPRPGGARASLALAANTAGPSCYTAPGRLDDTILRRPLLRGRLAGERSRVRRGRCEERRALW